MTNGWDCNFDVTNISDEVKRLIQDYIEKQNVVLQKRKEEIIQRRKKEIEELESQYNELINDANRVELPKPTYYKCTYCPCMNDGRGGLVVYEANESDAN